MKIRFLQESATEKKAKLDLKDRKILLEIAKNSRTPLTRICKKVGLSRDSVAYRIKNLEKVGLIQGYRTIVDIEKFTYTPYHLFISLTKLTKDIEDNLIKKFSKFPFMRAVIKFAGKFDYELAFIAKNIRDLDKNINEIIECCSKYMQDYELLSIVKNYRIGAFPKSFYDLIKESISGDEKIRKEDFKCIIEDKKNLEILRIIADNANLELYKIGEKCNLSPDTVSYRIKKMVNCGIILKFVPVINFASISYNIYGVLMNIQGLSESKEERLKECLNSDENILWAAKTVGKYNVLLYVCVNNAEQLHETLRNIRNSFSGDIKSHETLVAYEEYKYTYFPNYVFI